MLLRPTATTASAAAQSAGIQFGRNPPPDCSAASAAEGSVSQGMENACSITHLPAPPGGDHQADFTRIPFQGKKLGHGTPSLGCGWQ